MHSSAATIRHRVTRARRRKRRRKKLKFKIKQERYIERT